MKSFFCFILFWSIIPNLFAQAYGHKAVWKDDGTNVTLANTNRNVGIGVTTPSVKLQINGNFLIAADGFFGRDANYNMVRFSAASGNTFESSSNIAIVLDADNGEADGSRSFMVKQNATGFGGTTVFEVLDRGDVVVGSATGGFKGAGTINVAGDIYKNGTAYTNPDYVFERNYPLMPLPGLVSYVRTKKHLPGVWTQAEIDSAKTTPGLFEHQRTTLEKLEEAYLYIFELNRRLAKLEKQIKQE